MNLVARRTAFSILLIAVTVGLRLRGPKSTTTMGSRTNRRTDAVRKRIAAEAEVGAVVKTAALITAEGSSTVYPMCQTLVEKFEQDTKFKVSVSGNGTSSGYKKFAIRQADIWNASRPIAQKEIDELKEKGIGWLELNIAVDGIVIAVNSANDWCPELSCAQLKRIWEPESKIKKWSDLDPAWPAQEMQLYGADVDSGTFEYFTEVINGKKAAININYTSSSNDNVLVDGISSNKYALGFIPFGYYIEKTEKLKPLGVSPTKEASETPGAFIQPSVETILSGEYSPLARPLFMYANKEVLTHRPEVAEFLRFVVSEEAQPLIEKRGFVRVKDEIRQEMAKKLEDSLAGQPSHEELIDPFRLRVVRTVDVHCSYSIAVFG